MFYTLIAGSFVLGVLILIGFAVGWLLSVIGFETAWGIGEWLAVGLTVLILKNGIKIKSDDDVFVLSVLLVLMLTMLPVLIGYGTWLLLNALGLQLGLDWAKVYLIGLVLIILRVI